MSVEALSWALNTTISKSSVKFCLFVLANLANEEGMVYPSIQYMTEKTAQDRKTVLKNIQSLKELGFLSDTGRRTGETKQIIVYRLNMITVPKKEQSQKRNSTVFPCKESQIWDTDTKGTLKNKTPYIPQTGESSEEENPKIEETLETSPLDKQKQNPEQPQKKNRQVDVQTFQNVPPDAASVIDYLNERTGKSYRPVKANLRLICGRLKEGYTVDDMRRVIDLKTEAWGNDGKMREYLRPATLFGALNFAQYSAEPVRAKKEVWEL